MKPEYNEVAEQAFESLDHRVLFALIILNSQLKGGYQISPCYQSPGFTNAEVETFIVNDVINHHNLSWHDRTRLLFPEKPWFEKTDEDWMDELSFGERFEAILRHVNEDLNLPDEQMFLTCQEDGYTDDDGDEISHNWNIIKWRQV